MAQTKVLAALLLFVFVLFGVAASANAAEINTATIRAHVLESHPDCDTCTPTPHGCFVVLDFEDNPVTAYLPPLGEESCSVAEDACIEATGSVVNGLTTLTAVSTYQFVATTWSDVGSLCDE